MTSVLAPCLVVKGTGTTIDSTLVMGVVNTSPDSFSDAGQLIGLAQQRRRVDELVQAGAHIIDIGGQSAITGRPETRDVDESALVQPLVEWMQDAYPDTLISVDTYKPLVARRAVDAGADIINDVSGLRYPEIAEICAESGAALVVMHTKARPKQALRDSNAYADVADEVLEFLERTMGAAVALGVARESIIIDPGPDFAKTPHQTIALLRRIGEFRRFSRPLLLALSRKDFLGAITGRSPLARDAATVAAIAHIVATPGNIVRVHDVAAAVDAVRTVEALTGRHDIPVDYVLPDAIRHEPSSEESVDAATSTPHH